MADLDNLVVTVGGDISDLQTAFDQIPAAAQAAASAVQDAFAGQTDLFSDVGAQAQQAFAAVPEAAATAADGVAAVFAKQGDLFAGLDAQAQQAFAEIPTAAETAAQATDAAFAGVGEGIAQSFQPISGAVSDIQELVAPLTEVTTEAGAAAGAAVSAGSDIASLGEHSSTAAAGVGEVPPALNAVGGAANEAESGLAGTVEQLIALGEALVVTEALKEFAGEALTVYGNVEQAVISLTALTGSAEAADTMIETLKGFAISDALSFEPLVSAAQRMTALGFSAGQVNTALQTAADTAAATGGDFGQVASAITRMALSGTAGARQLGTLGISANSLAGIMGTTAAQVTTAFKALDQTARLDVLESALTKFGGIAGQVAEGILGQWQNFKTQFEFVMESIGSAFAPVAEDFMAFVNSSIIPFIQGLVGAFNNLPGPVKDVVIAITALGAIVPIVTGALSALSKILGAIEAISLVEWGTAVVGAVGNVAFAVSEGLVGALTAGEMALYGLGAAAVVAAAGFAGWKLGAWLDQNSSSFHNFSSAWSEWLAIAYPGLGKLEDAFNGTTADAKTFNDQTIQLAAELQKLGVTVAQGPYVSIYAFRDAVNAAYAAMVAAKGPIDTYTSDQQKLFDAINTTQGAFGQQKTALGDAKIALEAAKLALDTGTGSLGSYKAALTAVDTAQKALNPNYVTAKEYTTDLTGANKDLASALTLLDSLMTSSVPKANDLATAQNNVKTAEANSEQTKLALLQAINNVASAEALGAGGANTLKAAQDALKTAETNAKSAKTELSTATKDLTQAQKDAAAVTKEAQTAANDYATYLQTNAKSALNGYATDLGTVTGAQKTYDAAMANEQDLLGQLNALTLAGQQNSSDFKTVQLALADAHQQVATDLKALNSATTDYNTTNKTLASAQKDILSSQQQLDAIYTATSIPNVKDLTGQLQNLRDVKTQVTADTNAQNDAETALQTTLDDYVMGLVPLSAVTQAQNDLDKAKTQTTGDNKDLKQTETDLQTAFGLTKQAMQDIQNPETTMTQNTQNANAAFSALGIQSAASLQTLADKATTAFNTITTDGTSSPQQIQAAQIKMLQAVQAAYIAEGTNLNSTQQATLTDLLNKQTDFNNSMVNQWHNLYVTIEGDVSSLSNQLVTDLFTGSNSFGKDAIAGLEKIAAAFVSTLIKPITDAIGQFIAGALTNLLNGIKGIGTSMSSVTSSPGFGSFMGLFNSGGVGGAPADALNGVNALGGTDLAAAGQGIAESGSQLATAAGGIATSVTGAIGAIGSVVGAITGIIGDIETGRSNDILYSIEQNTTAAAILLGQQIQLMWRLAADLEFGETEKNSFIIVSLLTSLNEWGLKDLDNISGNSTYQLQALNALLKNGLGSSGSASAGTAGGTAEYLPGTAAIPGTPYEATVPISFPDIEAALNNYSKILQEYVDGQATGPQVQLAQQQVQLSQNLYNKQQEYNTTLEKYLADPTGPGMSAALAFAASQLQAAGTMQVSETTAGTPAGPPELVTTVGELVTANTALDNINTTLQFNVGLSPWFHTAFQNINNGIVACAGWLQGLAGMPGVTGSATSASTSALASIAAYVGANFASLEAWLLKGFGESMPFPAIPAPIAVPSALGGAAVTSAGSGGVVVNNTVNVNGSVVGQGGMTQLTQTIGDGMVAALRRGGLKLA